MVKASKIDVRTTSISSEIGTTVVVPPASSIKTFADLKGKKIAVLVGTGTNYGLLKTLANNGLGTDDVQLLNLGPATRKPPSSRARLTPGRCGLPSSSKRRLTAKDACFPEAMG